VYNATTNTWQLDLTGWGMPAQTFGLRVGTERGTLARYPNGDAEIGDGLSYDKLPTFRRASIQPLNGTKVYFSNPEDWPGVFWLDQVSSYKFPVR
jgi:hypothetical protein